MPPPSWGPGLLVELPTALPLLATGWDIKDNTAEWQKYVDERKKVPLTDAEAPVEILGRER